MDPVTVSLAFVCYAILVYALKRATYPKGSEPPPPFPRGWETGHEYTLAISQDFWWAKRFKARIGQFDDAPSAHLRRYVQSNNRWNLRFSFVLTALVFLAAWTAEDSGTLHLLLAMAVIRFVSRSFEIGHAFCRDVLQQNDEAKSATDLGKLERIRLALASYVELFVYSAGAYLALPGIHSPGEALTLSLNVGTLTNVGLAFAGPHVSFWSNAVFVQVFATLSLMVPSLASYLSRER